MSTRLTNNVLCMYKQVKKKEKKEVYINMDERRKGNRSNHLW